MSSKKVTNGDNQQQMNEGKRDPDSMFDLAGMLHGGQSLRVFTKWCSDEKNMII
ncbi:unnamed protein product, partial [Gongylonema pulchrum]|uniref:Beta-Casp domain-containing protein n=1 Tax=Gongylonema pulchrum TaxID=637853 RepID=A0A183DJA4_9BILA